MAEELQEVGEALPRLTAESIREAIKRFPKGTSGGYDGFRIAHFGLLQDRGLEALAAMFSAAECRGAVPTHCAITKMPMLPKEVGFRLIGVFSAFYRIWARARASLARAWEQAHDRPFWAAAAR